MIPEKLLPFFNDAGPINNEKKSFYGELCFGNAKNTSWFEEKIVFF